LLNFTNAAGKNGAANAIVGVYEQKAMHVEAGGPTSIAALLRHVDSLAVRPA
jgi:hypothetical protein